MTELGQALLSPFLSYSLSALLAASGTSDVLSL